MDLRALLTLFKRRWLIILVILLLTTLSSYFFSRVKNKVSFENTIFLSVGVKDVSSANDINSDIYENVQAADQFTETIMGWFKNPDFMRRIGEKNNTSPNLTVRKQEKQNLFITFNEENEIQAKKIMEDIKSELLAEMNTYNTQTNSSFELPIFSTTMNLKQPNSMLYIILGIIGGLILGASLSYFYEYIFNLASYEEQIVSILHKNPVEKIMSSKTKNLGFIEQYLQKINVKKVLLVGQNTSAAWLEKKLALSVSGKKFKNIQIPEQIQQFDMEQHVLLICRLGKTKLEDLKKIQLLLPQHFDYIILQS